MADDDVAAVADPPITDRDRKTRDAIARARAGELLGPIDLIAIFKISRTQFHRLNRQHAFDQFRVHPPLGPTKVFSGALIARYLAGDPMFDNPHTRRRR